MKTSEFLQLGEIYNRHQFQEMFAIHDANLKNGVFHPSGHDSVWLFITEHKSADRTQYSDYLDEDALYWDGQTMGRTDRYIINHRELNLELLVFYRHRRDEYPDSGFKYEGEFEYFSHTGQRPTHFTLVRNQSLVEIVEKDLASQEAENGDFEGGRSQRLVSYYERNPQLRAKAIELHGTQCMVCGFNFAQVYGVHGAGYIEVHHLKPVSSLVEKTLIDPEKDMVVVCANCHRMIHRRKNNVLSLDELRTLIRE